MVLAHGRRRRGYSGFSREAWQVDARPRRHPRQPPRLRWRPVLLAVSLHSTACDLQPRGHGEIRRLRLQGHQHDLLRRRHVLARGRRKGRLSRQPILHLLGRLHLRLPCQQGCRFHRRVRCHPETHPRCPELGGHRCSPAELVVGHDAVLHHAQPRAYGALPAASRRNSSDCPRSIAPHSQPGRSVW